MGQWQVDLETQKNDCVASPSPHARGVVQSWYPCRIQRQEHDSAVFFLGRTRNALIQGPFASKSLKRTGIAVSSESIPSLQELKSAEDMSSKFLFDVAEIDLVKCKQRVGACAAYEGTRSSKPCEGVSGFLAD